MLKDGAQQSNVLPRTAAQFLLTVSDITTPIFTFEFRDDMGKLQ